MLSLSLVMLRDGAYDAKLALAADDLALRANLLYGGSDLHESGVRTRTRDYKRRTTRPRFRS